MIRLFFGIGLIVFGVMFLVERDWMFGIILVLIGFAIAGHRAEGGHSINSNFDNDDSGDIADSGSDGGGSSD